ncbi:septal ring lytic transglycosylase RlpA family protein [Thermoleptolyngbya sichuanensis A183]|uniref:Probable endolytic peptidoglycan transglycosylase RlpA n=1 Tax=Thermoleptolyngbya sichuanensis A183 TaxID=2737172 RepID=A0A6M8BI91_9CYAN|nr:MULTISPECIES: septal ring lytic transglycosylase RlpA family protein [Thermoleptolyngbya]QKD82165.1 septal ring lytic transglycosylase RlpA family protein [Thermoleptolyngbya sichuanensis A183]
MSPAETKRSPAPPLRRSRNLTPAADSTQPKTETTLAAAIARRPPAMPRVTVRPAAAPATGAQQVFKQCLDSPPASSEGVKRGATQQTPPAPARPDAATVYQIWVNGKVVMELPSSEEAAPIAQRLTAVLGSPGFSVDQLRLVLVEGEPGVALGDVKSNAKSGDRSNEPNERLAASGGDRLLFRVDRALANRLNRTADLVAIDWLNNLRVALGEAPLSLMEAQADLYSLTQTSRNLGGITSWYGPGFHNRLTANGERFNQYALTAAHPKLPFNTYLRVTNVRSGESVIVRINDRGPYVGQRSLDLSRQAARCIGSEKPGVVRYEAVILEPQTTVQ